MVIRFRVRIEHPVTGEASEDENWEVWSGGGDNIKNCKPPRTDRRQPPPRLEDITLRGPMTADRSVLSDWIRDTIERDDWKRNVTITEILDDGQDGKKFTYYDCFPTRYVFPALSAAGTGNLYEEVDIKPIRLELA